MMGRPKYIAEPVPAKFRTAETPKETWYVHLEGYGYVPVFGSIGDREHAKAYAKRMNRSIGREGG